MVSDADNIFVLSLLIRTCPAHLVAQHIRKFGRSATKIRV